MNTDHRLGFDFRNARTKGRRDCDGYGSPGATDVLANVMGKSPNSSSVSFPTSFPMEPMAVAA